MKRRIASFANTAGVAITHYTLSPTCPLREQSGSEADYGFGN